MGGGEPLGARRRMRRRRCCRRRRELFEHGGPNHTCGQRSRHHTDADRDADEHHDCAGADRDGPDTDEHRHQDADSSSGHLVEPRPGRGGGRRCSGAQLLRSVGIGKLARVGLGADRCCRHRARRARRVRIPSAGSRRPYGWRSAAAGPAAPRVANGCGKGTAVARALLQLLLSQASSASDDAAAVRRDDHR